MMANALPPPPLWIVKDVVAYVKDANNGRLHVATIKSNPFIENGMYRVKIKWDSGRDIVSVDCSLCDSPLVDESSFQDHCTRHRLTRRPSVVKSHASLAFTPSNSTIVNQTQSDAGNDYKENDAEDDILDETAETESPGHSKVSVDVDQNSDEETGSMNDNGRTIDDPNENEGVMEDGQDYPSLGVDDSPDDVLWIHKGDVIFALGGKKEYYSAKVVSDPYREGASYKVCIKWMDARYKQVVDCRDCLPLESVVMVERRN